MLCINQLLPSLQQFHSYRLPKRCRPAIARGHHSKGPLWCRVRVWVRVRVSDWRTFAMAAPNHQRSLLCYRC